MTEMPSGTASGSLGDFLRGFDVGRVSGEGLCLSLGEDLGKAFDEFQRLTESFRKVETIFTGSELETLSQAIGEVRHAVADMTGGLDAECEAIETLVSLGNALGSRFETIRRWVRTIAALATNSRVEAASVDSRLGEVSGFALELVNLAAQIQKAIDGCCREQAALADILKTSRKTLVDFKQVHGSDLGVVERDLGAVGGALADHRARIGHAAATLANRSNDITSAIGTIVMALQIGDSTRQRAEHVIEGIEEVLSLDADAGEAEAATAVACRLGALQLAGAHKDFAAATGQISSGLLRLSGQADDIVTLAGEVSRNDGNSQSFIESIKTKLATALDLSQRSGAARSQVDTAVSEMTKSTAKLDRQMQDLSDLTVAMTMIGINAILKAKRVGSAGLGLGVIADQLRGAADTVVAEVNEVMPMLGKAVAQTKALADTLAGRRAEQMDRGSANVGQALATFASCDEEIGRSIGTLVRAGGRVARDLESAAGRPDAQEAAAAMDDASQRLAEISEALAGEQTGSPDLSAAEATFLQRYTMASERAIHQAFWSDGPAAPLQRVA